MTDFTEKAAKVYFYAEANDEFIPQSLATSLDAIIVLGGGVPSGPSSPPEYVEHRCDAAAKVYELAKKHSKDGNEASPSILCLSAGTAHLSQLLDDAGLPIWESTASAAYLMKRYGDVIPSNAVFAETASYDTISNAYFSRSAFTEINGWRKLLIVTNEFHMDRTKAIFDWIFHAKNEAIISSSSIPYELYYLSCDNVGLTPEAIRVRKEHEARGTRNVCNHLSTEYISLKDVWTFLTQHHDLYNAKKLAERAARDSSNDDPKSDLLKQSYGAHASS